MSPALPPPRGPFTKDRINVGAWPITVDEALGAALDAGFHLTARSATDRLHVQRDWLTAAMITPTAGGVVVELAWTVEQAWFVLG